MTNETTASQPKSIWDDAKFRGVIRAYADKLVGSGTSDASDLVGYLDSKLHVQSVAGAKTPQKWQERIVVADDAGTMLAMSQEISEWRAPAAQTSATIQAAPDMSSLRIHTGRDLQGAWLADQEKFVKLSDVEALLVATIQEPVLVAEPVGALREALDLAATWIENIKPEELELWRDVKAADIRRVLRAAPMVADPAGVELAAQAIFKLLGGNPGVVWVPGGNSFKQDEARDYARAALAATVKAVPSEAPAKRNEQAKFEEWSVKWKYNLRPANEGSADTYMEGETETAWMGWMACVDSFAAPLADKTGGGE